MFYRWYITQEKLTKMYKNVSSECWKREEKVGIFFPMWWMCSRDKDLWKMIHEIVEKILQVKIGITPEVFLLNKIPPSIGKKTRLI